jgi:riboflavin biosynthesis pyrimidine reductase
MAPPDWKRTVPLPPTVRLAWHATGPFPRQIPLDDLYAPLALPIGSGALPYLVANMAMTQNGEATVGGKASPIGTAVDGLVLTRLRRAVDAVLSGSGTLVHDDVIAALPETEARHRAAEGRSPRLLAAVVASSLSFGGEIFARRFFADPGFDKLIVTGPAATPEQIRAVEDRGVEVVRVAASGPDGRPSPRAVLDALRARGVRSVVCEGGPRFLPSLFAARVVREYFLTTSPLITGEPGVLRPVSGPVGPAGTPVWLSRISRYEHDFDDPTTGAHLVEAFDRFRVVYPP